MRIIILIFKTITMRRTGRGGVSRGEEKRGKERNGVKVKGRQ